MKKKFVTKQIDYILVSHRWRSSIKDSKVRWGPSIHRNKHGAADHALVDCQWNWRVKDIQQTEATDYSSLTITPNPGIDDRPAPRTIFVKTFTENMKTEQNATTGDKLEAWVVAITRSRTYPN